jgi:hypothetical protein
MNEVTTDKLAEFREAAKTANQQPKSKMTERAAAALRALGEHDKSNKVADAKLVERFNAQPKTVESIMDMMYAISTDTKDIRKCAIKACHMLSRGLKVYTIHDVMFLGSLLPEEEVMSIGKIMSRYPVDEDKAIKPEAAPERLCALGSKCLRSYKRKAAPVTGKGMFCSSVCKGAAKRRLKKTVNSPVLPDVAPQGCINSGVAGGLL